MDIARLGFSVATNAVDKAKASLRALIPAAKDTAKATDQMTFSFMKADGAMERASVGAQKAKTSVAGAASGASSAGGFIDRLGSAVDRLVRKLTGVGPAAQKARSNLDNLGRAANDNINKMQATPGNIAAQFQDIGVSAAGGMSPMLIALQQGTQLSAAMSGGLKNLVPAFKQVFNAASLLTIGIVGLVAALLQMVNWSELAADALDLMADVMVDIAPYAVGIAGALALIYSPAIIGGIIALTKAFIGLTASMVAALGIPALIVLGLAGVVVAANAFRDELTEILGFDIVKAAKDGINYIVGSFIGAYKAVEATWKFLPYVMMDIMTQVANRIIRAAIDTVNTLMRVFNPLMVITDMIGLTGKINADNFMLSNPFSGAADNFAAIVGHMMAANQQVDWLGKGVTFVREQAGKVADIFRDWATGLRAGEGDDDKDKKSTTAKSAKGKSNDELFAEVLANAAKQERALISAGNQIGVYGEQLAIMQYSQNLVNEALDKGIVLNDQMKAKLIEVGTELGKLAEKNRVAAFHENLIQKAEMETFMLERERGELGLTRQELIAYRYETDILAEAKRNHIQLTENEIAAIKASGEIFATQTEEIRKMRDALDFARGTTRGFFEDLRGNLEEGKSLWKSFGNAVIGVLNRIIDRMFNSGLDALLDGLFKPKSSGGGGGGGLGSIFKSVGNAFASIFNPNKLGNAYNDNGIVRYANGGAFTNKIVSQPTLFSYAKGTAMGEMGEAGPEAIMPLHRGPDGSLGVRALQGQSGVGEQRVKLIIEAKEGKLFRPIIRAEAQETAVDVVTQGLDEFNDQLPARVQQIASDDRLR